MELITSRSNPLLAHMRKLLKSRSYRRTCNEGISDGVKLLEEAIRRLIADNQEKEQL